MDKKPNIIVLMTDHQRYDTVFPYNRANRIGDDKYKDVIRDLYKRLWQFAYEHKDTCINPYIMVGLAQYGPGIIFGK